MKLIKAKFIKNDVPSGIAYTYRVEDDIVSGDYLQDAKGAKLIAVDEPVDMTFVEKYGLEKIKVIGRYVEPEKESV